MNFGFLDTANNETMKQILNIVDNVQENSSIAVIIITSICKILI
ncbi:hypothetical protein [Peribacillus glennii]|nr:hypothetical protein [Peribacillus glennii]